jgi:hypothetical protein
MGLGDPRLRGEGLVAVRVAPLRHEREPEISFCGEPIVSRAAQGQIRSRVRAVQGQRLQVMKLQAVRFAAALAALVDEAAARAVSPIHLAPHRGGDVSAALARCRGRFVCVCRCRDALARLR